MPVDFATLGIIATIIGGTVSVSIYISHGFRNMEAAFYKALDVHKKEDGEKFERLGMKVQRLELKEFGFTVADKS